MRRDGARPVVVVTGASAGVGRATSRAFARRGARLGLLARDRARLEKTKREVERLGGEAIVLVADVADSDAVDAAARDVETRLGPIDIWVNNAMVTVFGELERLTPAEYRRVTDVVYHGTVHGTMAALRYMRPRRRGTIVQVGSALAYRGIPLQSAYCGAKHAILGMFDSLRAELIHQKSGIHLTMVQMPALNTPQFLWSRNKTGRRAQPVPPIFQPEVAADAIVFAATHRRREVKVGRSSYITIAGNKMLPALGDVYLGAKGYEAQELPARETERPDNLWQPVPGDFGAHGPFDDRSADSSVSLWLSRHRRAIGVVAAAGALVAAAVAARRR